MLPSLGSEISLPAPLVDVGPVEADTGVFTPGCQSHQREARRQASLSLSLSLSLPGISSGGHTRWNAVATNQPFHPAQRT